VSTDTTTLPDVASLHPSAVQAIAKGEVDPPKKERKRRDRGHRSSRVRSNASIYDQMLPEVAEKVRAMDPDLRHVQVLNSGNVVIWNHPAPWPGLPKSGKAHNPDTHTPEGRLVHPPKRRVMGGKPPGTVVIPVIEDQP